MVNKLPHVLLVPYPLQGHVTPLMELAQRLAHLGVIVTFVNTESVHAQLTVGMPENPRSKIRMVSIPDGAENDEDRKDLPKFFNIMLQAMPTFLEQLIVQINEKEGNKITMVIAGAAVAWLLNVAGKLNIRRAAFTPTSAWLLATVVSIPMLIENGVIDKNGFPKPGKLVELSDRVPPMDPAHLCWLPLRDPKLQESHFKYLCKCLEGMQGLDHILCNTFSDLESPALELIPNAVPVGPLVPAAHDELPNQPSSLWVEDSSCISWLNQQPTNSVVYVSFGSTVMHQKEQLHELALGLELVGRPFLWVSGENALDRYVPVYPKGFVDRVGQRGCIAGWAAQQEVLAHPSVACFLTHCGWNSTMEGLSYGVPMLCWPYFTDQFQNQTYIADVWKVGLKLIKDDEGIVRKEEIKNKVEALIGNREIRKRVSELKEKARTTVTNGGDSFKNLESIVNNIKERMYVETPKLDGL